MLYYMVFLIVTLLLFHYGGIITADRGGILNLALNPQNLKNSEWYITNIKELIALGFGAAVSIGLFVTGKTEIAIKALVIESLVVFGWDLIILYTEISARISTELATLIISPLLIAFVLLTVEWLTGAD